MTLAFCSSYSVLGGWPTSLSGWIPSRPGPEAPFGVDGSTPAGIAHVPLTGYPHRFNFPNLALSGENPDQEPATCPRCSTRLKRSAKTRQERERDQRHGLSGQIQQFRDGENLIFMVEQIDLLASSDDTGSIELDLSDSTSGESKPASSDLGDASGFNLDGSSLTPMDLSSTGDAMSEQFFHRLPTCIQQPPNRWTPAGLELSTVLRHFSASMVVMPVKHNWATNSTRT